MTLLRLCVNHTSRLPRNLRHAKAQNVKPNSASRPSSSGAEGVAEEALLAGGDIGICNKPTRAQLMKLCAVTAVPFIGFGFADNAIMIIAGDAIDQSLGVKLGISTMAAAGLGNMMSDIVGLGIGDIIEGWCHKLGFREPPLTVMQRASKEVRRTKTFASMIGLSVGCLLGMVPLLFMTDRKKMYFNEKELFLYETFFQPFGVSPPDFFDLMTHCKWRTAEAGGEIVPQGQVMDRVILVHNGSASAYVQESPTKLGPKLYTYRGREGMVVPPSSNAEEEEEKSKKETIRGSIIGGSALVDLSVLDIPYPNAVKATSKCEYVEWKIHELREQMRNNKAVEAAVYSTLYLDLVEGIRRQTSDNAHADLSTHLNRFSNPNDATAAASRGGDGGGLCDDRMAASLNEFSILMRAVLADGRVHSSERQMVREFMASKGVSQQDHRRILELNGWTQQEWDTGRKSDWDEKSGHEIQERIKEIPVMMKKAGIRSRVVDSKQLPTTASAESLAPSPRKGGETGAGGALSK